MFRPISAILIILAISTGIFICLNNSTEATAATSDTTAPVDDARIQSVISPNIPASVDLCGLHIDLDRNDMYERFDRELTSIMYSHGSTLLTIKRANKYFPALIPLIKAGGVPLDMVYLACAESMMNPRAYSPAKAAGFWQFIPTTARTYGLEVNDEVDERYNLEKATAAACRYLKDSYKKFGDWPTVMAAYNAGNARITKALDSQRADNSFDLYLNEETSRYVFRIMAYKAILENPADFGFILRADQLYAPVECDVVEVKGPVSDWAAWAEAHGTDFARLKDENLWIRSASLTNRTGKTYKVRVPKKHANSRSKSSVPVYNKNWVK